MMKDKVDITKSIALLYYILTLCFRCVVCFLLFFSVNSHYYKTCHGTYLSQIHVFGFDVIFVILIGYCIMLSPFLCVLHFNEIEINPYPSLLIFELCYHTATMKIYNLKT